MKSEFVRFLFATMFGAVVLGACDDTPTANGEVEADEATIVTPAGLGLGDGWTELEPGLWTRNGTDGGKEFVGIGEPGRQHALASLEAVEDGLRQILLLEEREETRAQLKELDALIAELSATEIPLPADDLELRCSPAVTAAPDAYSTPCGVAATSTASWSHCSHTGTVRAYAQAGCGSEIKTHQCGPKTNNPASCTAQMSITGPAPCRSYAYAQINAPDVYVFVWDENLQRGTCSAPPPPPPEPSCGPCSYGKSCHCGDICRPINTYCP